jgi:hypothetical protein
MKNSVFWDITLCIPVKASRSFGGIYRLHLQVKTKRSKGTRMKLAAGSAVLESGRGVDWIHVARGRLCEHGNKPSLSRKGGKLLDYLSYY